MPADVDPLVDGNGIFNGGDPEGFNTLLSLFGLDAGIDD